MHSILESLLTSYRALKMVSRRMASILKFRVSSSFRMTMASKLERRRIARRRTTLWKSMGMTLTDPRSALKVTMSEGVHDIMRDER